MESFFSIFLLSFSILVYDGDLNLATEAALAENVQDPISEINLVSRVLVGVASSCFFTFAGFRLRVEILFPWYCS